MNNQGLNKILQTIEQKLQWGDSSTWSNQDFELLSDKILEHTGEQLSVSTLKRIWGKVDYKSAPSPHTLNTLVVFLGYENLRDFNTRMLQSTQQSVYTKDKIIIKKAKLRKLAMIVLVIITAVASLYFMVKNRVIQFDPEEIVFTSKTVASGIPNTVVFEYDVSSVDADSFFIQQSWDRRRRQHVSAGGTQHTSFYYYPGYFHAKLIANDQIIKNQEVFVESDGWLAVVERFPEPVYVNDQLKVKNGEMSLDFNDIKGIDDHLQDNQLWFCYYYVKDLGENQADDFSLEARFKNDTDIGSVCRETRLMVICTNGRYSIPFSIPGCVSKLNLSISDTYIPGKDYDLTQLGCDLTNWVDFKMEVSDKKAILHVNDNEQLEVEFTHNPGRIVGIRFKFNGPGSVDYVKYTDANDEIIFEDDFEMAL